MCVFIFFFIRTFEQGCVCNWKTQVKVLGLCLVRWESCHLLVSGISHLLLGLVLVWFGMLVVLVCAFEIKLYGYLLLLFDLYSLFFIRRVRLRNLLNNKIMVINWENIFFHFNLLTKQMKVWDSFLFKK